MTQTDTHIGQYIPQAAPFIMVGEVLEANEQLSKTSFTVAKDNILVKNGHFTEGGLVENMAQTAAAGMGYRGKQEGKHPIVGFIGALKNLHVNELPKVGDVLTTEARFTHTIMNVHIVQGTVFANGKEMASCELKIFLQQ
ncbi:MAG: 3-hydroxyacyl-ACP dehydratase [Sphingobacteriales bacterium]|nr:MAG: 3-hydroxyacyl-ACP dehydratase [Sphingobacteriales bacterium]